jgi:predicted phosphodiesterase
MRTDHPSLVATFLLCTVVGCSRAEPVVSRPAGPAPRLGPMLCVPDGDTVRVWWQLSEERDEHVVAYGADGTLGLERTSSQSTATPCVTIDRLEPGRRYSYTVRSGEFASAVHTFALPPSDGPARIAVWGDNQNGVDVFSDQTVPAIAKARPDVMIGLGDFVQRGHYREEWDEQFFGPAAGILGEIPLLPVRGNHDGEGKLARAMLPLPDDRGWYAATFGTVRLVVLDTNLPCEEPSAQFAWLRGECDGAAWRDAALRVVAFHHPPFSVLWDEAGYDGEPGVRSAVVPLIEAHGADLVLSGHAHAYERFHRERPDGGAVEYLVLGGGGGKLDTVESASYPWTVKTAIRHHIAVIDVAAGHVEIDVVDTGEGEVFDTVHIEPRAGKRLLGGD